MVDNRLKSDLPVKSYLSILTCGGLLGCLVRTLANKVRFKWDITFKEILNF